MIVSSSRPDSEDPDRAGADGSSMFILPKMVPGDCGQGDREQGSPECNVGVILLPPPGETRHSSRGWLDGPAPGVSSGWAEGIYIESRQACSKVAVACCSKTADGRHLQNEVQGDVVLIRQALRTLVPGIVDQ